MHPFHSLTLSHGSVHSGSESWDDCGSVYSDELRLSLFPWWLSPLYLEQAAITTVRMFKLIFWVLKKEEVSLSESRRDYTKTHCIQIKPRSNWNLIQALTFDTSIMAWIFSCMSLSSPPSADKSRNKYTHQQLASQSTLFAKEKHTDAYPYYRTKTHSWCISVQHAQHSFPSFPSSQTQLLMNVCVCVCVCFHIIPYVNCFGRTVLYMCIEYCI